MDCVDGQVAKTPCLGLFPHLDHHRLVIGQVKYFETRVVGGEFEQCRRLTATRHGVDFKYRSIRFDHGALLFG